LAGFLDVSCKRKSITQRLSTDIIQQTRIFKIFFFKSDSPSCGDLRFSGGPLWNEAWTEAVAAKVVIGHQDGVPVYGSKLFLSICAIL